MSIFKRMYNFLAGTMDTLDSEWISSTAGKVCKEVSSAARLGLTNMRGTAFNILKAQL